MPVDERGTEHAPSLCIAFAPLVVQDAPVLRPILSSAGVFERIGDGLLQADPAGQALQFPRLALHGTTALARSR